MQLKDGLTDLFSTQELIGSIGRGLPVNDAVGFDDVGFNLLELEVEDLPVVPVPVKLSQEVVDLLL